MKKYIYVIAGSENHICHTVSSIISTEGLSRDRCSVVICNGKSLSKPFIREMKKCRCRVFSESVIHYSFKGDAGCTYRILLLEEDHASNIDTSLFIIERYKDYVNIEIYVIAPEAYAEMLFDSVDKNGFSSSVRPVKLRRIFLERSLVYNILLEKSLFESAVEVMDEKIITVVCLGYDTYVKEMIKACLWCGQMDGYVLKIYVISDVPNADDLFFYECPEIKQRNKLPRSGEDYYEIDFLCVEDYESHALLQAFDVIENPSWYFISIGDDSLNIQTGIKVRECYSRKTIHSLKIAPHYPISIQMPKIQVVCSNDITASLLNGNKLINYKGQCYNIEAVGNDAALFHITNLTCTKLEEMALGMHLKWGDPESFNDFEYNRVSSMSSAIHKKYRDEFYPDNDVLKDILEHKRWNAFMRGTLGYVHGLVRDDLARQHNCLVKYDELPGHEKAKDAAMNSS